MPVVNLEKTRLRRLIPGRPIEELIESLPFIGLDIEGVDGEQIRVEYNPNRPDFSSDYGIARALRGLLGTETGLPKFRLTGPSGISIKVDPKAARLRPAISALVAVGGELAEANLKQLIAIQEDLHNGLGRRRRKASIGIHDLDSIKGPLTYTTVGKEFSFIPLGETQPMNIEQILCETEAGKSYSHLASNWADSFPVIVDSTEAVLSFPPIINGNVTRVSAGKTNLLIEVTATDSKIADDILAIFALDLSDAGYKIKTVEIKQGNKRTKTPLLPNRKIVAKKSDLCEILGIELSDAVVKESLKKCRLDASINGNKVACVIPAYRADIQSSIDLSEELAIGYGIQRLTPSLPSSFSAGSTNTTTRGLNAARRIMIGLGLVENMSFSLTNPEVQFRPFSREPDSGSMISVDSPKSSEHVILRDSIIPSLLEALSRNIHEQYPQRLFEIGKVFRRENNQILEKWNICAISAHADADYTEAKSMAVSLLEIGFGLSSETRKPAQIAPPYYVEGRTASLVVSGVSMGSIGEIKPQALEQFKMRMPAAAFEIDLSALLGIQ